MAGKSDFLENELLDHVMKVGSYSAPTNLYIGLYTVTPTDAGGGTEVSGSAYARVNLMTAGAGGTPAFGTAAASGSISNDDVITFPQANGGNWGTVVAFGIFDASSAGNLLYWGPISPNKTINDQDTASFAVGALTITED